MNPTKGKMRKAPRYLLQFNEFPRNLLAALDALAELGKAVQNKEQPSGSRPARLQSEFKPDQQSVQPAQGNVDENNI